MRASGRILDKMAAAGQSEAAIHAFLANYRKLVEGGTGLVPEASIEPVGDLPRSDNLPAGGGIPLLEKTVILKLNGGLGTGMGLDTAKSLLRVKEEYSFLDLIVRQFLHLREAGCERLRFLLMNSFSTSADTLAALKKYPQLGPPDALEFLQSQVPKIDADSLEPVEWGENPALEWCPPGHGDLYASIEGSGQLDLLLADGVKFAFVSNSDNLGATPDPAILRYFAEQDLSFLMEVTRRTGADRKGGHLATDKATGRLLLRESAQCPGDEAETFQDIARHRYFNTNNLWIRLDRLKSVLESHAGVFPLPLIRNVKTVDPKDAGSPRVYQLETAMGAAISEFPDAGAIEVPRRRFAPVKKTGDLLVLRSDACEIRDDWTLGLVPACQEQPPRVELDPAYTRVDDLDRFCTVVPSLRECRKLVVEGKVVIDQPVTFRGEVVVSNPSDAPAMLPAGEYRDQTVRL